jgi:hypothetical protein
MRTELVLKMDGDVIRSNTEKSIADSLNADPWVAASLLQKAIRRGRPDLAERAAECLWRHRGPRAWLRLVVTAVEDVGIGSVDAVAETVRTARAMTRASARRPVEDPVRAICEMARVPADAPKDRSTDYLVSIAVHDASLDWFRLECLRLPVSERIAAALADDLPANLRAVAAWTACGLGSSETTRLDRGDRAGFFAACIAAGVPADLVAASADATTMSREPICVLLPIVWLLWRSGGRGCRSIEQPVPDGPSVAGIPLWSLDKHTRSGKAALARLVSENAAVREVAVRIVGRRGAIAAVEMAAYYLDAAPVSRRLDWPLSLSLEAEGRRVDFAKVGVPWDGVDLLMTVMADNRHHLDRLRAGMLITARVPAEGER